MISDVPRAEARTAAGLSARAEAMSVALADVLLRAGVLGVLVAAPLAFGATSVLAGLALSGAAWLLLMLWMARGLLAEELKVPAHPVALPALLLLGYAAVHWVAGLSADPYATQREWLHWMGYAALAVAALAAFSGVARMERLLAVLAGAGFVIAVLGIAQHLTAGGKIYWLIEPTYGGWVFGPYANRNHFAGLMELWMPLAAALALRTGTRPVVRWCWWLAAITMSTAVALSGSRGGLLALAVGFVVLALGVAALRGGRSAVLALALALVLVGGATLAIDGEGAIARLMRPTPADTPLDEVAGHRLTAWQDTLKLFRQNWLLGTGLETFAIHFPGVRSFWTDYVWSHAHNDFLQFLAELGIVGAALAAWIFVAGARSAAGNLRAHGHGPAGVLLVGLLSSCAGFLVHGWLDFNFHVPANAANFGVLAALLVRRGWDED
jgi:O-antigen ligase